MNKPLELIQQKNGLVIPKKTPELNSLRLHRKQIKELQHRVEVLEQQNKDIMHFLQLVLGLENEGDNLCQQET